jgi:septal ring factor EnvC (AmiA/AmiB activator)
VKVSPDFVRTEGGELSVEEMYKRTLQEVGSLREQLAERKEYARQSRASEEVMRERVQEVREIVHEEQINKKDIAEELARQYKTMRSEKDSHILYLQTEVKRLRDKLDETESELVEVRRERDKLRRQKEEEVSSLNARLHAMERSYDAILEDALDSLCCKMEELREKWDFESRVIDQRTQQTLLEFVTPG